MQNELVEYLYTFRDAYVEAGYCEGEAHIGNVRLWWNPQRINIGMLWQPTIFVNFNPKGLAALKKIMEKHMRPLELAIEHVKEGILKKIEEEKREQERRAVRARLERAFFGEVRTTLEAAISQLADVKYDNTESTIRFVHGKQRSVHVGYHCFEDNWENRFDALGISFEMGDRRRQFRDTDLAEGLKEFLLHVFRIEIESLCHERLCNSKTNS